MWHVSLHVWVMWPVSNTEDSYSCCVAMYEEHCWRYKVARLSLLTRVSLLMLQKVFQTQEPVVMTGDSLRSLVCHYQCYKKYFGLLVTAGDSLHPVAVWYLSSAIDPRCLLGSCSLKGRLLVRPVVQQSSLLAMFEIDFLFLGSVGMYEPIIHQVCHTIKSLLP